MKISFKTILVIQVLAFSFMMYPQNVKESCIYMNSCVDKNKIAIPHCGTSLELFSDSTFYFLSQSGISRHVSWGEWHQLKHNYIILNSRIEVNKLPIVVKENKEKISTPIIIIDKPIDEYLKCDVIMNDIVRTIVSDTLCVDFKADIDSIRLCFYYDFPQGVKLYPALLHDTIKTSTYYVQNKDNNVFYIAFLNTSKEINELFYFSDIRNLICRKKRNHLKYNVNHHKIELVCKSRK